MAVAAGDHVRLWNLASGDPLADVRLDSGAIDAPAVDGRQLYVQTVSGRGGVGLAYALEFD